MSTVVPYWFQVGTKFNSRWIADGKNTCIVLSFNEVTNLAEIEIKTDNDCFTEDGWNLEHTIWGFEKKEYTLILQEHETDDTC